MVYPSVSVITINRNTGVTVGQTIRSVLSQTYPLQWIVVDGASCDGSLAALRSAIRPGDVFVSEADKGIADAFNKGLALATAEAVVFMNAGDEFADPDSLRRLVVNWKYEAFDWAFSATEVVNEAGVPIFVRRWKVDTKPLALVQSGCRIFHQSVIVKRQALQELGGFNPNFRLAMDYDLWLRLIKANRSPQIMNQVGCRFHLGGMSSDLMLRWHEDCLARRQNGLANSWYTDLVLRCIVSMKCLLHARVGAWAYRLKEFLGW